MLFDHSESTSLRVCKTVCLQNLPIAVVPVLLLTLHIDTFYRVSMKVRVVSFLVVWACAILATCVMAAPSESGSSDNTEALDEDSQMALMWGTIADTIPMYLGDDSIDEDDDDTFTRRRRLMGGIHSKHPGSRRRFRGRRPRVFVPRRRPGSRGSSRNNVSPY